MAPRTDIRITVLIGAIAVLALPAAAQHGQWHAHTSMQSVREVAPGGGWIWAATSGGVFGYDPATGEVLGIINSVFVKGTKESALESPTGITYAIPVRFLRALLGRR